MTKSNQAPAGRRGLYIHIPFCASKCNYCDFLSFGASREEVIALYFDALKREIRSHADLSGRSIDTIFIGGGTPSSVPAHYISDLMVDLRERSVGIGSTDMEIGGAGKSLIKEGAEITIEANPGTLDAEKLRYYKKSGINRLSMGVQSFDASLLKFMGRIHGAEDVLRNFREARSAGFDNINLDLIFGVPGQTLEVWEDTLKTALSLDPEHISFYSLQIEEGTPLYIQFGSGSFDELPDELNREMYYSAIDLLIGRGYVHYEISNAAKPGFECSHNLKYWSMKDYLGLGLGAHSYIDGTRFSNTTDLSEYLSSGGKIIQRHDNSSSDELEEFMFTGLRKVSGISAEVFARRFGCGIDEVYGAELARLESDRLIARTGCGGDEMISLTLRGIDISNTVLCEFIK